MVEPVNVILFGSGISIASVKFLQRLRSLRWSDISLCLETDIFDHSSIAVTRSSPILGYSMVFGEDSVLGATREL